MSNSGSIICNCFLPCTNSQYKGYLSGSHYSCPHSCISFVTWYATKRGKVRFNFPYSSVFELTSPNDWPLKQSEYRSNYLHSITCDRVDREGNVGHWVAWPDEEEEGAKWLAEPLAPKNRTFSSEEIWKRIFSFENRSWWIKTLVISRSGRNPRKKHRTESLDSSWQKGCPSQFWGWMSLVRKRKEYEK